MITIEKVKNKEDWKNIKIFLKNDFNYLNGR